MLLTSKTRGFRMQRGVNVRAGPPKLARLTLSQEGGSQVTRFDFKIAEKQRQLRQKLWPDLDESKLWVRTQKSGFTTIPRTMPLILQIMDAMSKGKPVSTTYLKALVPRSR